MGVFTSLCRIRPCAMVSIALILAACSGQSGEPDKLYAPEPHARLLTNQQYANTIHALFGDDIAVKVRFPPLIRVSGLTTPSTSTAVLTSSSLAPLEAEARSIAAQVVSEDRRDFLIGCAPARLDKRDDKCAGAFLARVGRLLFRRPLEKSELQRFVAIAGAGAAQSGTFHDGLGYALYGMLISPDFLYAIETVEPAASGGWQLDAFSKATRLSLMLWGTSPDDALLSAAENGDLDSESGIRDQVDRMIASPRFETGIREFFSDMLLLDQFDALAKDAVIYPAYTIKTARDARESLLRTLVDHVVHRNEDYRGLFTTRRTFLTSDLGAIYRVPVRPDTTGWEEFEFREGSPRVGILSQVAFLSQYSHAGRSSPTRRGRGLRQSLFCQEVPDPPPNVDFSIVNDPNAHFHTARERLTAHRTDPTCAGCHKITDEIGLTFENFDGAGQYRSIENGVKIDVSGALDGIAITDTKSLGEAVAANPALTSCIVQQVFSYGIGQEPDQRSAAWRDWMKYYRERFGAENYRMTDLIRTIATSPAFFAATPPSQGRTASNTPHPPAS